MSVPCFLSETVCGLNKLLFHIGHCIGGGAMLALAHDYQIMRSDKGWFSIPIVRLKHTLPLGLLNLAKWVPEAVINLWLHYISTSLIVLVCRAKLPQPGFHIAVVTGKRFSAKEAKDAGFISDVSQDNSTLMKRAIHVGDKLSLIGVDRSFLSDFKQYIYHNLSYSLKQSPIIMSHIWLCSVQLHESSDY